VEESSLVSSLKGLGSQLSPSLHESSVIKSLSFTAGLLQRNLSNLWRKLLDNSTYSRFFHGFRSSLCSKKRSKLLPSNFFSQKNKKTLGEQLMYTTSAPKSSPQKNRLQPCLPKFVINRKEPRIETQFRLENVRSKRTIEVTSFSTFQIRPGKNAVL